MQQPNCIPSSQPFRVDGLYPINVRGISNIPVCHAHDSCTVLLIQTFHPFLPSLAQSFTRKQQEAWRPSSALYLVPAMAAFLNSGLACFCHLSLLFVVQLKKWCSVGDMAFPFISWKKYLPELLHHAESVTHLCFLPPRKCTAFGGRGGELKHVLKINC